MKSKKVDLTLLQTNIAVGFVIVDVVTVLVIVSNVIVWFYLLLLIPLYSAVVNKYSPEATIEFVW